jgi:retinol dehydrogenase 12
VLLAKGARVYLACPDAEKANAVIEELKGWTEKDPIFFLMLDLSDLASIKTAAEEFLRNETELHTLYHNG